MSEYKQKQKSDIMKKKKFIWRDCKTFFTLKEVEELKKTKEEKSIVLVDYMGCECPVVGKVISTNWLSDNAFYLTFLFELNTVKHGIKIKQNIKKPEQRYLEEMDPDFLERLLIF